MLIKQLYDKISAAVGDVARAKNLSVVVATEATPIPQDLDSLTVAGLRGILNAQHLIYAKNPAEMPDISDEVIALLNQEYRETHPAARAANP